jgi:hypothetical protein
MSLQLPACPNVAAATVAASPRSCGLTNGKEKQLSEGGHIALGQQEYYLSFCGPPVPRYSSPLFAGNPRRCVFDLSSREEDERKVKGGA